MKTDYRPDCTTAPQVATLLSNIDAISDAPRDVPRPADAWPAPRWLPVGRGHRMAWRSLGQERGEAWLLLHGGPGSGAQPGLVAPLDLRSHRAIAPDQRGSGASRPRGGLLGNHTQALVADLEVLRKHLGVPRWSVLGGSWGAVLALAYAQRHPQRVQRLVLRGTFALSRREVGGLLLPSQRTLKRSGAEPGWPVQIGRFLPVALRRLTQLLQSGTPAVASLRVVRRWSALESGLAEGGMRRSQRHAALQGQTGLAVAIRREWTSLRRRQHRAVALARTLRRSRADRQTLAKYRVQAHYLRHRGFMRPPDLGLAVAALAAQGVALDWVHGRFDGVCPPANSRRLAALGGRLHGPLGGHLGHEPDLLATLRACVREASP